MISGSYHRMDFQYDADFLLRRKMRCLHCQSVLSTVVAQILPSRLIEVELRFDSLWLSRRAEAAKAIDYMLKLCGAFSCSSTMAGSVSATTLVPSNFDPPDAVHYSPLLFGERRREFRGFFSAKAGNFCTKSVGGYA